MKLNPLPFRENKPRNTGVTMVMDKGLSLRQAEDLMDTAGHLIDFLKLGFGTSVFTRNVKEKVKVYRAAGTKVFVGGTLFEAYAVRGQVDDYLRWIDHLGVDAAEVSDGSMLMPHNEKCKYISLLARDRTVLSEVGAKEADVVYDPTTWVTEMKAELAAGSSFVIAEARESGTVGIYNKNGKADTGLIDDIKAAIPPEKVIWEAPLKPQQVWFLKLLGHNVNLGNIAPADIIPLETLRMGLRGDTFFEFLPGAFNQFKLSPK
ncbi:MAG: phosphosulfolactate synthase [Bacteroidales bacterium]|jgi:phosphosulfolactate synthase|nr:phosphosulfolactate synthase [Bacteroidales bacterium]NLM92508.1 phosphosulfolactate synthase [Bacteroidales bacterium]